MEENSQQKKNRLQQIYTQAQTSFFNIMFELLKEKKTSKRLGLLTPYRRIRRVRHPADLVYSNNWPHIRAPGR